MSGDAKAPAGPQEKAVPQFTEWPSALPKLCAALQEEMEHYEAALHLAEGLPTAVQQGQNTELPLRKVLAHLMDIARIEENIGPAKQQWVQLKEKAGPELEAYRTRLFTVMQQLRERLQQAEQEATLKQRGLVRELDGLLRGQRMQQAYGAVASGRPIRSSE